MPTVTLCVIARNEEALIGRCLASVSGAVDQVVVVDTGSTDRTADRAREAGAEVSEFSWCDDFAAARNASIERARGDWILVLDADEQLATESRAALKPLLEESRAAAFSVVVHNLQPPGELVRFQNSPIVRLFRNAPGHRYRGIIHESVTEAIVEAGGRVAPSPLVVVHDGYAHDSVQGGAGRATRNLALLQMAASKAPTDPYLQYQLGVTWRQLGNQTEARRHLRQAMESDAGTLSAEVRSLTATKLAQIALADRRHGSAVAYASRALEADPHGCIARMVMALALVHMHRYQDALPPPGMARGARAVAAHCGRGRGCAGGRVPGTCRVGQIEREIRPERRSETRFLKSDAARLAPALRMPNGARYRHADTQVGEPIGARAETGGVRADPRRNRDRWRRRKARDGCSRLRSRLREQSWCQ